MVEVRVAVFKWGENFAIHKSRVEKGEQIKLRDCVKVGVSTSSFQTAAN